LLTRSLDEIVWAVNPRNDSLDGFVVHICQLAPELLRAAGIRPRLDMPMEVPPIKLAPNVRHQLYLALKEALHNVIKHANATEVWVRLKIDQGLLTLSVEDNGRGFEAGLAQKNGADGLMNLRHRMEDIGGQFEQQSEPDRGTRIAFVAPLNGKPGR
jgi:signal transduction histidine kinase